MSGKTWLIIVIVIIIIGVIVGVLIPNNTRPTSTNIVNQNSITNTQENTITNEIAENNIENKENNQSQNETTQVTDNTQTSGKKQSAIDIVKKDYGEGSNIEFSLEGTDGKGRQIVVVRNSDTTEALAFYFVDEEHGTFDKQ